jgi:hypothetical protein
MVNRRRYSKECFGLFVLILNKRAYSVAYSWAGFACGSKEVNDFFLQIFARRAKIWRK